MFEKIKLFFWRRNSSTKCPFCGSELIPHLKDWYTCPKKDCGFN